MGERGNHLAAFLLAIQPGAANLGCHAETPANIEQWYNPRVIKHNLLLLYTIGDALQRSTLDTHPLFPAALSASAQEPLLLQRPYSVLRQVPGGT